MPRRRDEAEPEIDPREVEAPYDLLLRIWEQPRYERAYAEEVCVKYKLVDDPRRYRTWVLKFKAVYFLDMMRYKRGEEPAPEKFLRNYRAVMSDRVDRLDSDLRVLLYSEEEDLDMVKKADDGMAQGQVIPRKLPPKRVVAGVAVATAPAKVAKPKKEKEEEGDGCPFRGNIAVSYNVIVAAIAKGITDVDKLCSLLEKQNPPMPEGKPAISRLNYVMKKIDGVRLTDQATAPAKAAPAPKAEAAPAPKAPAVPAEPAPKAKAKA